MACDPPGARLALISRRPDPKEGTPQAGTSIRLPPEVWLKIFSHATNIPGALTHEDDHAIASFVRDTFGICLHSRFRQVMKAKLAVSLVCKYWNALVTQFLFEYLLVESGDQAVLIANALERRERRDLQHGIRGPGYWTRRLELALEGVHIWTDEYTRAIERIFRHCPNLTVFSNTFCTTDAYFLYMSGIMDTISSLVSRSRLRRLELKGDFPLLESVVASVAPTLEVLWLIPPPKAALSSNTHMPRLCFPKLRTLVISFPFHTDTPMMSWDIPALKTFIAEHLDRVLPYSLRQFFEVNCRNLQYLALPIIWFDSLAHVCPDLQEWVLPCRALVSLPPSNFHPSVRRLTLAGDLNQTGEHLGALSVIIASGSFMSLELIRFLLPARGEYSIRVMQSWDEACKNFLKTCNRRGIRIEASLGADDQSSNVWQPFTAELFSLSLD